MKFVTLEVVCNNDLCKYPNRELVKPIPGYTGTILKSFWCACCKEPIVIRYQFADDGEAEVLSYEEAVEIYAPRKPETGITIRPRAGKRHNR